VALETEYKTLLNRGRPGYSINCYTGCAHGCIYCYARFMHRFHPYPEPWGEFVDLNVNAADALAKQLDRTEPGGVFVSSACDARHPPEGERELTREYCRLRWKQQRLRYPLTGRGRARSMPIPRGRFEEEAHERQSAHAGS